MSKIHLIAIGGAVMHNVALALHQNGHEVSGSDDQIYEPAYSRLLAKGILPSNEGWNPESIPKDVDFVILGMHAKKENPELLHCLSHGIKVYSFPEYVAESYKTKTKIVVAGSHGKTTTTSILMHIFRSLNQKFDYLVGAQLNGFDNMVSFSDAPLAVIEGDEYLSSAIDLKPKFLHYHPQMLILTGIAWDHYNVFPTYEKYVSAFDNLLDSLALGTKVFYYGRDKELVRLIEKYGNKLDAEPYFEIDYSVVNGDYIEKTTDTVLKLFGRHNMQNISASLDLIDAMNLNRVEAIKSLSSFVGAAKRQEELINSNGKKVFRDFAHAPSKLRATLDAFREKFPNENIGAFIELHTYSSLNKDFLPEYKDSLVNVSKAIVYYDQRAIEVKKLERIDHEDIQNAFGFTALTVCSDSTILTEVIQRKFSDCDVILFLGSGNFGGMDLSKLAAEF